MLGDRLQLAIKNISWLDLSLLLVTLIIMLLGIGDYGLYEPHEGHFAMVGREMVLRNDWITPHLNGAPYLNKPPLLYWAIALSTSLFGSSEFAARLPISLAGWLGIVIAWQWTRQLWGVNASRLTALMLSVSLGWFIFSHQILIDVLLGSLLLASYYCLWRSLHSNKIWLYNCAFYVLIGLCLLTKGLIGIAFPLASCSLSFFLRRDWRLIRRIHLFTGLLITLAVFLPWFIAVERENPGFLHYFIVNEHIDRLLDRRFPPDYEVSQVSAVGYLATTALWCFPWSLFLPSVVGVTWREWREGIAKKASARERERSDGIMLVAIAAMLPVILFLPVPSRLIYYSIPAIPPYIMLCGAWWSDRLLRRADWTEPAVTVSQTYKKTLKPKISSATIYGSLAISISLCFIGAIAFIPQNNIDIEVYRLAQIVAVALALGWLGLGVGMLKRYPLAWLPLFVALIVTYGAVVRGFVLYQDVRASKTLVRQADPCLNDNTLWIFEGSREIGAAGGISYYLNRELYSSGSLPAGWQRGEGDRLYRTVMVLSDGGKNRIPPSFPGSSPSYLITKQQLQSYWNGERPVVFVTDFLRQPDDKSDPLERNLPDNAGEALLITHSRRLYGNAVARRIWCR